jgi:hypothetical protein
MPALVITNLHVTDQCDGYYLYGTSTITNHTICIACLGDGADLDEHDNPLDLASWATHNDIAEAYNIKIA